MDNIYDTLAKLNKVANAPEIVKEDSNALMKKGLEDLMKKTKLNKQADYTPFSEKQSPDGLPEKKKDDKMFEAEATWPKSDDDESAPQVGDTVMHDKYGMLEVVKISDTDMMGEPAEYIVQTKGGKKRISYDRLVMGESVNEANLVEKESDVERDNRAEKAGREVAHDAKYDGMKHAGKDGKDVTKDIEYDEKHDKDGMHENAGTLKDAARQGVMARLAELAGLPVQEIEEALGTPQDVAAKIMAENPLDEADVEEGNEFSGERDKAIKAGKDSFEVDGKTYPVKGDKKNEAIEEAEHDGMPSMKEMKACVDKGMTEAEICEKYSDCDQDKIKLMASKCSKMDEGTGSKVCDQCEDGKDEDGKECSECGGTGYPDLKKESEEKVEETTSSGSVATGDGAGKPLFKNASIYESNEIVKRAKQLNEDMSISVNAGTNAEPSININASGEEAAKLAQLLKLAGMGMAQPGYGEVQVDVAEDQEFANGADDTNTMDTEYMTQDIAGGLNGPKKMAYPKVAGGDNPMSVLGESELNEVSEDHIMKLYQEYKAK